MEMIDLFSGIGGFSLAGHWLGWNTIIFIEKDKYCQKVLSKNFPKVPIEYDIKEFSARKYRGAVDIITGGFPCQPASTAGNRKGKEDYRWLWPEMFRTIRECQPPYVVGENVTGLLSMDNGELFKSILSDLESEGYEVQTFSIPASATGAAHKRERVWIVGYSESYHKQRNRLCEGELQESTRRSNCDSIITNPCSKRLQRCKQDGKITEEKCWSQSHGSASKQDKASIHSESRRRTEREGWSKWYGENIGEGYRGQQDPHWFEVATRLCRVDDGLPSWVVRHRTNRLKALGNAIRPQVVYEIFKAIDLFNKDTILSGQ